MNRLSLRLSTGVAAFAALVLLAGCGGPSNLVAGLRNPLGGGVCGLVWLVLSILALLDLFKSNRDSTSKIIWAIVIVIMPVVGSAAYYLIGRRG